MGRGRKAGFFVAFILLVGVLAGTSAAGEKGTDPSDALFGEDKLWTIHIRVSQKQWEMMQPSRMPRLAAALGLGRWSPPPKPGEKAKEGEFADTSAFGYQFAYVKATFEFEGQILHDVGVRFKGNSSYSAGSNGLRRPFKIDFNRFVDGQKFHGLTQLNLNNNAYDPSQLREALSFKVYRDSGVPAARTAFAIVYLTVEGQHERACLGLYTIVEEPTKDFLKNWFDTSKGLLVKPEGFRGLPYLGENWLSYQSRVDPKTDPTPYTTGRLIGLCRLINQADDNTFRQQIEQYLAVDEFLRYLAASTLLANLDSFLGTGHNYLMYIHPQDGRAYVMPWDLNLSFGTFGLSMPSDQRAELSIERPYYGENRPIDRLLAITEYHQRYHNLLREMLEGSFEPNRLVQQIQAAEAVVRRANDIIAGSTTRPSTLPAGPFGFGRDAPSLSTFVVKRVESVRDQLAGKSQGIPAGYRRNVPPPTTRPGAGGGLQPPPLAPLVSALIRANDASADGKLSAVEVAGMIEDFYDRSDAKKQGFVVERDMLPVLDLALRGVEGPTTRPANQQIRGGLRRLLGGQRPPEPQGRPALSSGMLANRIMREADGDGSGKLTLEEMLSAGKLIFRAADRNQDQLLDRGEIEQVMMQIVPAATAVQLQAPVREAEPATRPATRPIKS